MKNGDDLQLLKELTKLSVVNTPDAFFLLRRIILMQEQRIQQLQVQILTIAQGVGLADEPENKNNEI